MKLRYLVIDARGQLRKVKKAAVAALWQGRKPADTLGCPAGHELRLVSVLCDSDLRPRRVYLLRLPLTEGRFTTESYLTLHIFTRSDCVTRREVEEHHLAGWPDDLRQQLAVALDVPVASVSMRLQVGGPLFMAAALRVSPRQALRYLL